MKAKDRPFEIGFSQKIMKVSYVFQKLTHLFSWNAVHRDVTSPRKLTKNSDAENENEAEN